MTYSKVETRDDNLNSLIRRVSEKKQHMAMTRRGKPVAAMVPIEDLEYLERLELEEEAEDTKACKAAEKESSRPFSEVRKELASHRR